MNHVQDNAQIFKDEKKKCRNFQFMLSQPFQKYMYLLCCMSIGAELGGAAGARAPPLLYNPRNFIV